MVLPVSSINLVLICSYGLFIMFWRLSLGSLRVCLKIECQFVPHLSVGEYQMFPSLKNWSYPLLIKNMAIELPIDRRFPLKTPPFEGDVPLPRLIPGGFVS